MNVSKRYVFYCFFNFFLFGSCHPFSESFFQKINNVGIEIDVNHTYKDVVNLTRRIYYSYDSSKIGKVSKTFFQIFHHASSFVRLQLPQTRRVGL